MAWNPTRYMSFGQARLRPALDLLAQAVAVTDPQSVLRVLVRAAIVCARSECMERSLTCID